MQCLTRHLCRGFSIKVVRLGGGSGAFNPKIFFGGKRLRVAQMRTDTKLECLHVGELACQVIVGLFRVEIKIVKACVGEALQYARKSATPAAPESSLLVPVRTILYSPQRKAEKLVVSQ